MLQHLIASALAAIFGPRTLAAWRAEPDPAACAADEARLVMASGLDGFEAIYAAQAAIRAATLDRALDREYWHNPPVNTYLN